jgi:hypothetical protein
MGSRRHCLAMCILYKLEQNCPNLHCHYCISQCWQYVKNIPILQQTLRHIPWINQVLAALSSHIYFIQIGAELAEIKKHYRVFTTFAVYKNSSRPRHAAPTGGIFRGRIRSWRHCPPIFISYKSVQNWLKSIHITVFYNICSI